MGLATIMMATLSTGLSSCSKDDPDPELKVSPETLSFGTSSDSKSFSITSNIGWTITSNKDWITVNQTSGSNSGTVYVDVEENKEFGEKRTGRIIITGSEGGLVKYVEVSQSSVQAKLEVSPATVSPIKGEGGTANFSISSNLKWQVSSNQTWLKLDKTEGNGNDLVTATAEPNGTSGSRSATLTFSGKEGNASSVTVTISQEAGGISVSPTSASLLSDKGSTTSLAVTATGAWTLTGCPDWLHASATSGNGATNLVLTALSENWSDEDRSAVLRFNAQNLSASVTVTQMHSLPTGLRVKTSNMTLMSDGFACDLEFGPETKGYREWFVTESAVQTMTDRDIYNKLMEQKEYNGSLAYTCLPGWSDPGTKLVYCVAAYGNENNSDGSHKYGPMTIERVTTKAMTVYDDMYLTKSYNSSRWTVNAQRSGNYGQRCDEYYCMAWQNDDAEMMNFYASHFTYALIAHLYFKPSIVADPNYQYKNGPQTMYWSRSGDKFFCTAWGIDRNTKEYSAELSLPVYYDLSSSTSNELKRGKSNPSEWNKPHRRPTQNEIKRLRESMMIVKPNR